MNWDLRDVRKIFPFYSGEELNQIASLEGIDEEKGVFAYDLWDGDYSLFIQRVNTRSISEINLLEHYPIIIINKDPLVLRINRIDKIRKELIEKKWFRSDPYYTWLEERLKLAGFE